MATAAALRGVTGSVCPSAARVDPCNHVLAIFVMLCNCMYVVTPSKFSVLALLGQYRCGAFNAHRYTHKQRNNIHTHAVKGPISTPIISKVAAAERRGAAWDGWGDVCV